MCAATQRLLAVALGSLLGLGAGACAFISCADPALDHEFVDPDFEEYRLQVLDSLAAGETAVWAGSYRWSNGREHHELDLASSGFCYEYSHCTGIGHLAYGTVEAVGEARVRL